MIRGASLICVAGSLALGVAAAQESGSIEGPFSTQYSRLAPVSTPAPAYPPEAVRNGEEGTVTVQLDVLGDGSVGHVEVVGTSPASLQSAAMGAAATWQFQPSEFASRKTRVRIHFRKDGAVFVGDMNLPREAYERPRIRQTPEGAVIELAPPATGQSD